MAGFDDSATLLDAGSAPLQHQLPGAAEIGHGGLKHRPIDPSGYYRPDGQSLRQVQVSQKMIESYGKLIIATTEKKAGAQRDALQEIQQVNKWRAEAQERRKRAGHT